MTEDAETDANADRSKEQGRSRADGGAAGADEVALDPWGSSTIEDYRSLFDEFGIENFESILPAVPNPHYLMRRGVIFGHREYDRVAEAMRTGQPFAALSGFMPTGDPHIGHKLVFDELIWHQRRGGETYALIADLEAHSARGLSWSEIDEHTRNYLLSLLALGFNPEEGELYRQSDNRTVQNLAFELGIEANFSELQAIYGFDGETDVSHMLSVVTQMADILYPQLGEPMPTVIPVGPDQDPHVRLARDLAARMRYFGVTEAYASFEANPPAHRLIGRAYDALPVGADAAQGTGSNSTGDDDSGDADVGVHTDAADNDEDTDADSTEPIRCADAAEWLESDPGVRDLAPRPVREAAIEKLRAAGAEPLRPRVRFINRRAPEASVTALIEAIDGEKRVYDAHIDSFDLDREAAERLARRIEVETGGYGFIPPSSIYHRFMTGLTGGKMSSSVPASHISLLDDPAEGARKVEGATTGGRETAELQRELGGEADKCPVYELYGYLLCGDDDAYAKRVYDECVGGDRLCGDCKAEAAALMESFLEEHQEQRAAAEDTLEDLPISLETDRP